MALDVGASTVSMEQTGQTLQPDLLKADKKELKRTQRCQDVSTCRDGQAANYTWSTLQEQWYRRWSRAVSATAAL